MDNKQRDIDIWRKYIKNFLSKNAPRLHQENTSTLEVGYGDSTPILKEFIPNLKVLDKRTDIPTDYKANLFDNNLAQVLDDQKFDLIFLIEVLEHTERPWEVEKIIKTILSSGGLLVITVPSFLWWHPLTNKYGDYWRFLPGHIEHLFPNMKILHHEAETSDYARPMGMCYILQNA